MIVEIEVFALQLTILDECQIYLAGRGTVWEEASLPTVPRPLVF